MMICSIAQQMKLELASSAAEVSDAYCSIATDRSPAIRIDGRVRQR